MHDITVRRMGFEFPEEIDPVFMPGDPEESYATIGLSLLLPHLEPYLIRTMKVARKQIHDPDLLQDLERFSAQEGQHYREHMRFNAALRLRKFPGLAALEAELSEDYQRFSHERPLRFNLAYAEGFEALTTAFARFSFEERGLGELDSPVADHCDRGRARVIRSGPCGCGRRPKDRHEYCHTCSCGEGGPAEASSGAKSSERLARLPEGFEERHEIRELGQRDGLVEALGHHRDGRGVH